MHIIEFSLIHHIMRLLQGYLTMGKGFGYFGLKLDKLGSYKTFHNAWCCELVYTVKRCKLRCEFHYKLVDTVNATGFTTKSYFYGFKRINSQ
jgi:hypothetical protein